MTGKEALPAPASSYGDELVLSEALCRFYSRQGDGQCDKNGAQITPILVAGAGPRLLRT